MVVSVVCHCVAGDGASKDVAKPMRALELF